MDETHGIESLKQAVKAVASAMNHGFKVAEDGKISIGEAVGSVTEAVSMWKALKDLDEIKYELNDLSEAEILELTQFFQEEFDVNQEKAETIIEKSIQIIALGFEIHLTIQK